MSGFNTKERNNYGEYEITFYTENREDFKKVQSLCRELIGNDTPVSTEGDLISRSELKEAIRKRLGISSLNYLTEQEKIVVEEIFNAPTVTEKTQDEWKKYKPLEPDYNVQCAVENLRKAYWSNEPEEVAKYFTEAEDTITSAICHYGYTVCKQPQGEWIRIDDEKVKCPICEVIHLMYSYPGTTANFCPNCGAHMKGKEE